LLFHGIKTNNNGVKYPLFPFPLTVAIKVIYTMVKKVFLVMALFSRVSIAKNCKSIRNIKAFRINPETVKFHLYMDKRTEVIDS